MPGLPCACVGQVTADPVLAVRGLSGTLILNAGLEVLERAWKSTFGDLI